MPVPIPIIDPSANFAYGAVVTAPTPATSGTTLTLDTGEGANFPDPATEGAFNAVVFPEAVRPDSSNAELIRVTDITGDVLTIERQQEGSSARSVGVGDQVIAVVTAVRKTDLLSHFDRTQSAGMTSGGVITDGGSGTVDVSLPVGYLRKTNSSIGVLVKMNLSALTGQALTDNSVNYIAIDYNGGTHQFVVGTSNVANGRTIINVGKVYREGTSVDMITSGIRLEDFVKRVQQHHVEEAVLHFVSGGTIGETGTRNVTVTAGVIYAGLNRVTSDAVDTSGADTFEYYYYTGSAWTESAQSQIDNTQYNDTASGLVALDNNKYGIHWVYKGSNGDIFIVYGQDSYTLNDAQTAQPPASLPDHVVQMGVLIGKIIIAKSASVFTEIQNATDEHFVPATVADHNELSNLQGGTTDQYYHLTSAKKTVVDNTSGTNTGDEPDSSTSAKGIIETATDAEAEAGTDTARAVTPSGLKAHVDNGILYGKDRQAIINGNFDVWQRGTTAFTATGYTADRWYLDEGGATCSISRQAFTIGQSDVPNNPLYYLRNTVSSSAQNSHITQRIEHVRTFSDGSCSVSFWMKSDASSGDDVSVFLTQDFGDSGSADVSTGLQTINLTDAWQKFELTFSLASVSGKTININNFLNLRFRILGTNNACVIDIAQVQVNKGSLALPYSVKAYEEELFDCQYYYHRMTTVNTTYVGSGVCRATTQADVVIPIPRPLRNAELTASNVTSGGTLGLRDGSGTHSFTSWVNSTSDTASSKIYNIVNSGGLVVGRGVVIYILVGGWIAVENEL